MFLKSLDIYGFKSFADKAELRFTKGITAIVGPNGSGKSNVGDAVRWVLGEQSAKQLRGGRMEDIIFGGTQTRKKLSFCEVTLLFDNTDRELPIDYSEVAITRRLYRSGESEYYINKNACRLKDVIELFLDTGIGKEGYSIIGQGKIDNILSNKTEERRAVFEEAAGIMKYKTKKLEAERRLERTRDNLTRLGDILGELGSRLEPLKEQSDKAQQYLSLRERLRELEVNFYLYQHGISARKKEEIRAGMQSIQGEHEEKTRLSGELNNQLALKESTLAELEAELEQARASILNLTAAIEKESGECLVFNERAENISKDSQRLNQELKNALEAESALKQAVLGDGQAKKELETRLAAQNQELQKEENLLKEFNERLVAQNQELEAEKNKILNALNSLSDVKSNISRYETMRQNIFQRNQRADERLKELQKEQQNIQEAIDAQNQAADALNKQKNQLEVLSEEKAARVKELTAGINKGQEEYNQAAAKLQAANSRLNMLNEMKNDYEGYQHSVKQLLKRQDNQPQIKKHICGVLAQLITVPREYEKAIEAALGGALQNIVTPSEEDAKALIEYLRANNLGRATFLPVSAIRGKFLSPQEQSSLKDIPGCLGTANQLIKCPGEYQEIINNLLGRTVICREMDSAINLARRNRHSFRIVTLTGDIINAGGAMTGGSNQSRLTSLLGRTREIDETAQAAETLKTKCSQIKEQLAGLRAEHKQAEEALNKLAGQLHQAEILSARDSERLDKLKQDLEQNRSAADALILEGEQLKETLSELEKNIAEINSMQGGLEQDSAQAQESLAARQAEYNKRLIERDHMAEALTAKKIQLAGLEKELAASQSDISRSENELKKTGALKARLEEEILKCAAQLEEINLQSVQAGREVEKKKTALEKEQERSASLELKKQELSAAIKDYQRKIKDLEQDALVASERRHKLELSLQKIDSDIAAMEQRIWDEYELTYAGAEELRQENFKVTGAQTEISKLRRAINELGNVNVNAIEEYVSSKERFESLTVQNEDLLKAERDLRKIIEDVTKKMEVQFKEQFAVINGYFSETFKELFGGGRAELRLENSEDILGSGIEIVAQPPGKALQLLSLLSGGERALTAIAILFAMLKLKPTPFCILDEIEAALDEANVYNFAAYLRHFAEKTQFIVITHRKPTMEEADALYGVAMEEKGVSKMVSVQLRESKIS